jgi:diaminopimelate epimerase
MQLPFAKYEGLGNDFVVVELERVGAAPTAEQAAQICDRHLGIGADGLLLVGATSSRPSMKVINADGSVPEMCGNGIRCVALHLRRTGKVGSDSFEIDTDVGPHACRVLERGERGVVEVSMRAPTLVPEEVPVVASAPVIDEPLALALQRHTRFPRHANVGFARVLGPQRIELAVYERGSGWTRACGTGACAAAVAAVETGRAQRAQPIEVRLPGGTLTIAVGAAGERMPVTGPARHVYDGVIEV